SDPAAILVHGFEGEVALSQRHSPARRFGKAKFGTSAAIRNAVFGAFFIVDRKIHGDPGLTRPARIRPLSAVSDKITRMFRTGPPAACHAPPSPFAGSLPAARNSSMISSRS